jgi:RHS repeat-associated protein
MKDMSSKLDRKRRLQIPLTTAQAMLAPLQPPLMCVKFMSHAGLYPMCTLSGVTAWSPVCSCPLSGYNGSQLRCDALGRFTKQEDGRVHAKHTYPVPRIGMRRFSEESPSVPLAQALGLWTSGDLKVSGQRWSDGCALVQNLNKRTNNTTVETFTVNALNQLTSIPDSTPAYDRRGNLVSRAASGNIPWKELYHTYDHENRLTCVQTDTYYTPESYRFKVEFVYDGQGRMRIKRNYIWSGDGWYGSGGETRYLYDGMLIVQERDAGNVPTVTYTRGRDLSGTVDGAGGIGGLLARSHGYSSGSWAYHNFYHSDGNGNVTALVNSRGTLQASYIYDPYGRYLSGTGTLLTSNVMRFSSKPWVSFLRSSATSGLYYYGYRFYDPYLQRWLNRDPVEEWGGSNLYCVLGNSPASNVDSDGLTWASNWSFFWDWLLGCGAKDRYYGANSLETREMRESPGAKKLRQRFYADGCKGVEYFPYRTYEALWDTVIVAGPWNWGSTAFQVGAFKGSATTNSDGTVTFCLRNTAGLKSASWFHVLPNVPDQIVLPILGPLSCPMRNINQTFCWTEAIDWCKCAQNG